MASLLLNDVEEHIIEVLIEISKKFDLKEVVDKNWRAGDFIKSQVLVTAIGRIGKILEVEIPLNCYIFYDKTTHKQLTIEEASLKLINVVKNGK